MTTDKARKRAVRVRMSKTGESYTAARLHVVHPDPAAASGAVDAPTAGAPAAGRPAAEPPAARPATANAEPAPLPPRAADPGLPDATVLAATGRDWDAWLRILDGIDATAMTHTETAAWLVQEQGVSGWWSQSITVGYERARGLRQVHQRPDGFYVGVSKTFDLDVARLWAAFTDEEVRATWLEPDAVKLRAATPDRTARFDFKDGRSRVNAGFVIKGQGRSLVAIEHARLASPEDVESMRVYWRERLGRLAATVH